MRERPILFSGEMVRAILDGRKSQTRRVIKPTPQLMYGIWRFYGPRGEIICNTGTADRSAADATAIMRHYSPYGIVGDRLWVRETFAIESSYNVGNYPPPFSDGRPVNRREDPDFGDWWEQAHYRATDPEPELSYEDGVGEDPQCRWKPSIHMPRWASRITLEITGVRVERLQDISEDDAVAEGRPRHTKPPESISTVEMFETSWNALNAKRGYGWDANPWVWVIEFKRVDAAAAAAARRRCRRGGSMSAWLRRKIHDWYCGANSWITRIDAFDNYTLECARCHWRSR